MSAETPAFEPFMLRGLTYRQARDAMEATGCAIRRQHWCAPIVRLIDGKPFLDNDGEVETEPFRASVDEVRANNWEMVANPADDAPEPQPRAPQADRAEAPDEPLPTPPDNP